jgi:hypothetical protein
VLSEVQELVVSGVKPGNWGDLVGLIIGTILFLAVVAYFWNKLKSGQMDGKAIKKDETAIQ